MSDIEKNNIDNIFEKYNNELPFYNEDNESLRNRADAILNQANLFKKKNCNRTKFLWISGIAATFLIISIGILYQLNLFDEQNQSHKYKAVKSISLLDNSKSLFINQNDYAGISDKQKVQIINLINQILKEHKIEYTLDNNIFEAKKTNNNIDNRFKIVINFDNNSIDLLAYDKTNKNIIIELNEIMDEIEIGVQEIIF